MPAARTELKTHYIRRQAAYYRRLQTPVEGLVYQAVPTDRLATLEDVYRNLQKLCKDNVEQRPGRKALGGILEDLAGRGFVKELHGSRLERVLAD